MRKTIDKGWDSIEKSHPSDMHIENKIMDQASIIFSACLDVEQLFELGSCVLWAYDRMANRSRIAVYLRVVATLGFPVSKKVNCSVINSLKDFGFVLEILQAICLIPTRGKDVEGYLPSN
jgi:hypothetical protein